MVGICALLAWVGANDLDKFVALVGSFACIPLVYIYPVSPLPLILVGAVPTNIVNSLCFTTAPLHAPLPRVSLMSLLEFLVSLAWCILRHSRSTAGYREVM
jgi:hypothetical protein